MTREQMKELVGVITERVYGDADSNFGRNGTGPVELRIGFINQVVIHDGIVILNAPGTVIETVMNWVDEINRNIAHERDEGLQVSASAGYGGLLVR
jgi:hypothetical protein